MDEIETALGRRTGLDQSFPKVKELGDVSKSDLVRGCGYVSTKKDGTERLNFTAFYEALLEAKGMNLGASGGRGGSGRRGRQLSYVATIQFNGNLLVGKAYTAQVGLEPGDGFEIKLATSRSSSSPWARPRRIESCPVGHQVALRFLS